MNDSVFIHSQDELRQVARDVLRFAKEKGATDAAVEISEGSGLSVTVRKGKVDTIEQNKDKGIGVTVYMGEDGAIRRGNASTSDFSRQVLARHGRGGLQHRPLYRRGRLRRPARRGHAGNAIRATWVCAIPGPFRPRMRSNWPSAARRRPLRSINGSLIAKAPACMRSNRILSLPIRAASSAAILTRAIRLSVAPIAGKGANMQRDDWYSSMRDPGRLAAPEAIGRYAAERALARLYGAQAGYPQMPGAVRSAAGGRPAGRLRAGGIRWRAVPQVDLPARFDRSASVCRPYQILEDPHVPGAVGSAPFDEEGVRTNRREVVKDGVVQGYFLSTYSARKLGMKTTGNAGGSHNLQAQLRR